MKNNVISFNKEQEPNDLLLLRELEIKHGFTYGYLYKIAKTPNNGVNIYFRGKMKLSEAEVLEHEKNKAKRYGWNK